MEIEFDETKRQITLAERGLDFKDAVQVFAGAWLQIVDDRYDYGEKRFVTFGELNGRAVAVVWTWLGLFRRIISMRHVHAEELEARQRALD